MSYNILHEISTESTPKYIGHEIRLNPWSKIYHTKCHGPTFVDNNCKIGPGVEIGRYTGFHAGTYASRCTIGAFCSFGSRNSIGPFEHPTSWLLTHEVQYPNLSFFWDEDFIKLERRPRDNSMAKNTTIGSDVWTGDSVIILSGLTIGNGCIIGAGSVVTKQLPDFAIAVGNPAVVKRLRFSEKIIERLQKVQPWTLELGQLSGLPFEDVERCLDLIEEKYL